MKAAWPLNPRPAAAAAASWLKAAAAASWWRPAGALVDGSVPRGLQKGTPSASLPTNYYDYDYYYYYYYRCYY